MNSPVCWCVTGGMAIFVVALWKYGKCVPVWSLNRVNVATPDGNTSFKGEVTASQTPFNAEYDSVTNTHRIRYILKNIDYTLVIPDRYVKYHNRTTRRYCYRPSCYSETIEKCAGPLENFHGIPVTFNEILRDCSVDHIVVYDKYYNCDTGLHQRLQDVVKLARFGNNSVVLPYRSHRNTIIAGHVHRQRL